MIERHIIRSKIDGNVFEIFKKAGEWVNAGDSVMRVIRMNRLRVQGFVDASKYDRHQIANQKVTVTATLANGRKKDFQGKVTYIGLEEHAGNRFLVWAEVENLAENGQWLLIPNDEVTMDIHLNSAIAEKKPAKLQASPARFKTAPPNDYFSSCFPKRTAERTAKRTAEHPVRLAWRQVKTASLLWCVIPRHKFDPVQ